MPILCCMCPCSVPGALARTLHDFAVTPDFYVLYQSPIKLDVALLATGKVCCFRLSIGDAARVPAMAMFFIAVSICALCSL